MSSLNIFTLGQNLPVTVDMTIFHHVRFDKTDDYCSPPQILMAGGNRLLRLPRPIISPPSVRVLGV